MEYLKSKFSGSIVVVRLELWELILSATLLSEYSDLWIAFYPHHTHTQTHTREWLTL